MAQYLKVNIVDEALAADPDIQAWVSEIERIVNEEIVRQISSLFSLPMTASRVIARREQMDSICTQIRRAYVEEIMRRIDAKILRLAEDDAFHTKVNDEQSVQ